MKIGALTAAGLSLFLASALGLPAHAQPSLHVIAAWRQSFKELDRAFAYRLMTTDTAVVAELHDGRYGKPPARRTSYTLAFSDVGCVSAGGDGITLYPTKRWGVTSKNLVSGKTSPDSSIMLSFPSAKEAKSALRALEAASPRIAQKLGACKSNVDFYHLDFGTVASGDDPFSWQQDSLLGTTDYNVWTTGGVLFAETNTPKMMHAFYKLQLSRIACVKLQPASRGMAATLYIYPALSDDVLAKEVAPDKPATFTTSDIGLNFNTTEDAQAALQYLQGKSGVFTAKFDACPWPGDG